ncbi:carboxypeptidase-like regulatory domain-containing protein [Sorangium sp. So ce131]|uniref:carboxypeptidase-like regulatory domain-containing protein n=1 Tax=Sorangium sp. So ce131 TaxID=3133282 RepID=UPI003F62822B
MSRRSIARVALLGCLPASAACSIPLESMEAMPTNACDSSVQCGSGATCAEVGGQRACVSTSAQLDGLFLEIRPGAANAGVEPSNLPKFSTQEIAIARRADAGQVYFVDVNVPPPASVSATWDVGGSYCSIDDDGGIFPLKVEFRRVSPYVGLEGQSYWTTSTPSGFGSQRFELAIPSGDYHVYMVPQAIPDCDYDLPPPIFLPNQHIPAVWKPDIMAGSPRVLAGNLEVPSGVDVSGWKLDLLEPLTGSVISQVGVLEQGESQPDVPFSVKFYLADPTTSPIIRLRPKDGEARPTMYWQLDTIALDGTTQDLALSLFEVEAEARRVEGRVLDMAGNPVFATVRIQGAVIGKAQNAAYKLDTETDETGLFVASLAPGEYVVYAQPSGDATKAKAEQILKVPAGSDCYCGQTILIPEAGSLRGRVRGPTGEQMAGAAVFAVPSVSAAKSYFDRVLQRDPLLPRQASGVLQDGGFSLSVDPGEFDFSIRPPSGSAYPWLVRPRLTVPSTDAPIAELDLTMPYPVVLQGVVRDNAGAPLRDALVVAWLPVESTTPRGEEVAGVLQIGEARSGLDGSYTLLLPPSTSR